VKKDIHTKKFWNIIIKMPKSKKHILKLKAMPKQKNIKERSNWFWVPSLYFAEGIPYVLVMTLSVIFYKRMGVSNSDIALYTSWLYLPWVIKPLWSPIVDILKTKRFWIIIMQLFIGAGLAGVALTIPVPNFFKYTLAFFWLLAFSSATHDIAADGFYMLGLSSHDQAFYVGIRSTFYRMAMLTGQGLLVIFAGVIESRTGLPELNIHVQTSIENNVSPTFDPENIDIKSDPESMYFLTVKDINVGLEKIDKNQAEIVLNEIESWNTEHGFYVAEENQEQTDKNYGWWHKEIAEPLAAFLKKKFNADPIDSKSSTTGNIAYTWFYLSSPPEPGEKVILNFTHDKGDPSISLVKSYRFEFSDSNWNVPAFAAFQLDPKLERITSASFTGLSGDISFAWTMVFALIAVVFLGFFFYHRYILPRPAEDKPNLKEGENILLEFFRTFALFFKKKRIGVALLFLLVYRLGESQLVKLASPFLLDSREMNGLGLTTGDLGLIYGTFGMIFLSLGGILGGILASRQGLKYWIWWMIIAMNLPNLMYVFLSSYMPSSLWIVGASVAIEQFGYGFGFTAYMLYMIYISDGKHKTAHFAITTGFMALGMMIPGMMSGWLQEIIGYHNFFIWVMICTIPGFLIIPFLKIDPVFGKKGKKK
jgi:PAT family beta-lactamase induction signal transducer AmpG